MQDYPVIFWDDPIAVVWLQNFVCQVGLYSEIVVFSCGKSCHEVAAIPAHYFDWKFARKVRRELWSLKHWFEKFRVFLFLVRLLSC